MILPGVLVSAARTQNLQATDDGEVPLSQRITLAQIYVSRDVSQNTEHIRAAFAQAKADDSQRILFPEGAVSGYHDDFDQIEVTRAFDEIRELCQESQITGLIGTCWKEPEGTFNEIRVIDQTGRLAARYAKICLTRGDAKQIVGRNKQVVLPELRPHNSLAVVNKLSSREKWFALFRHWRRPCSGLHRAKSSLNSG